MATPTSGSVWWDYLDSKHRELWNDHPDLFKAVGAARRWDNPYKYLETQANSLSNSVPVELERLVVRTLIMLTMPDDQRQALIDEEYAYQDKVWEEHVRVMRAREANRPQKPPPGGFVEVNIDDIQL